MTREHYLLFCPGQIGSLRLKNRLIRSATWDPSILNSRKMSTYVLDLYRRLALGGVGLIITGGFPVYRERFPEEAGNSKAFFRYDDLQVEGIEQLPATVHAACPDCKVIAQLEAGYLNAGPSVHCSPFAPEPTRQLRIEEIYAIIDCFVEAAVAMQAAGFDGVQLHAAHGGLLSCFLSPLTNRRRDEFGGSLQNGTRIIAEIVSRARDRVGNFPILIKVNATDYLPGGIDEHNFPELAPQLEKIGIDALEVSGGMWDCLVRGEAELGFRPVPAPESHTRIRKPEKQSYFLNYAESLELAIPLILVGGNRDVERLEAILQQGKVDFIALCRPLIREPDLPERWRLGSGGRLAECVSCNSCLYAMYVHPGAAEPGVVTCVCQGDQQLHQQAQKWLATWVKTNRLNRTR